jgi:hypothetical protein
VRELGDKAKKAVPELKKAKYTDAAKGAEEIASEAGSFGLSLALNGIFFTGVWKLVQDHKDQLGTGQQQLSEIATGDPKRYLVQLVQALKQVSSLPLPKEGEKIEDWRETWNENFTKQVKQNGRSLCNGLKVAKSDKLQQHFKVWVHKFNGFTPETMPELRDYQSLAANEIMSRTKKLLVDVVIEAKKLQQDL